MESKSLKNTKSKLLLTNVCVRKIIFDAFKEFRGRELDRHRLNEFEDRICGNSYLVTQVEASKRLLDLVKNYAEDDMEMRI